jgi:thioredoxin reductase
LGRHADAHDTTPDTRADLAHHNIPVVDGQITEIDLEESHNAIAKFNVGPDIAVDILFVHPHSKPSARLHESLGLTTVDKPHGIAFKVDERRGTSVPGIYAADDLASPS